MKFDRLGERFTLVGFGNVYSRRLARFLISELPDQVDLFSSTYAGLGFFGKVIGSTDCIEKLHGVVVICPFNPVPYRDIADFLKGKLAADATVFSIEELVLTFGLPKGLLGFPERTVLEIYKALGAQSPFCDKSSLVTLSAMTEYWTSGDRSRLGPIERPISKIYFDDELIPAFDRHIYVDAGAYTGDSFRAFARRFPQFDSAILFEPNHFNELSDLECERVAIRRFALGSRPGEMRVGRDALEMVPNFGADVDPDPTVTFATLDQSVESLSFLKIDCEGFDMEVLNGGVELVTTMKPIVALCVYHDPVHLIEGVQYFENIGGYRLFLRKYSSDPAELVLYGLPD